MSSLLEVAVLVTCLAPVGLVIVLAVAAMLGNLLSERGVGVVTRLALITALAAAATAAIAFTVGPATPRLLRYGTWFGAGDTVFHFDVVVDSMSLSFAGLSLLVCNVVAAFSVRYLHREPGFDRYFLQMSLFVVGITFVALAGSVELLFVGWELIGISSALLVGFFHERAAPVRNAMHVFAVYRLGDAAMLSAAVLLHHWSGSGDLGALFSIGTIAPGLVDAHHVLVISLLLIVAVAAKSALWPLSGWLPRAMEGPTPSSAVYYGALSIHAGCFLLLRAQPFIAGSTVAIALVTAGGVITTAYGVIVGRVQTDIKSAIAYATLTQVGIIVVEIALGLRNLAMLHIAGHACFRLLQFLSAPNVLHDLHELDNRLDGRPARPTTEDTRPTGRTLYRLGLERGLADPLLEWAVVRPFRRVAARLDALDRRLVGERPRDGGP